MTDTLLGPLPDDVIAVVSTTSNWIFLLSIVPLCWSTIRHPMQPTPPRAHPKAVTWLTWFLVGSMATIGQALGGAPPEAWTAKAALSAGPLIVAIVAVLRREPWVVTEIDRWSLWLCALGVAVYVPLFFGAIGPADPYAAGLVVVGVAILVDIIAAVPTWGDALRERAPISTVITFSCALVAVLAVLCILPRPWTLLSAPLFCFLALQMISIIVTLLIGRARHPAGTPAATAAT